MKIGPYDINDIVCTDCIEGMKRIPDNSIDLVVTSPPYDDIRKYKGFKLDTHRVGGELLRIMKDGGIVAYVVQDQTRNFGKTLTSFRTIVDWCDLGFKLFECIIYSKHGAPGIWYNTRFRVDHEYIPLFLKGERPQYFNKKPLMLRSKHAGKTLTGCATRLTSGKTLNSKKVKIGDYKCRGTLWEYRTCGDGSRLKHKHPATFPDQLPIDFIMCFCPRDGIVFDPFVGSGTTVIGASKLGRKFLGFDISDEYCKLSRLRLSNEGKKDDVLLAKENLEDRKNNKEEEEHGREI